MDEIVLKAMSEVNFLLMVLFHPSSEKFLLFQMRCRLNKKVRAATNSKLFGKKISEKAFLNSTSQFRIPDHSSDS